MRMGQLKLLNNMTPRYCQIIRSKSFNWNRPNKEICKKLGIKSLSQQCYVAFLRKELAPETIGKYNSLLRPVEFIHLKTGKRIKAKSITAFCKKAKLGGNSKFHITHCLMAKSAQTYKGWTTLEFYKSLQKTVNLKDSNDNQYRASGFELKNKLGSNYQNINKLITGEKPCLHSLYLQDTEIKGIKPITRFKKTYYKRGNEIFCQDGNQEEFAKKHNITSRSLIDLKYGKVAKVKGFEFYKGVEKDTRIIK